MLTYDLLYFPEDSTWSIIFKNTNERYWHTGVSGLSLTIAEAALKGLRA